MCQQKVPNYKKSNFNILEAGGFKLSNYKSYSALNIVYYDFGLSKASEICRTWPTVCANWHLQNASS